MQRFDGDLLEEHRLIALILDTDIALVGTSASLRIVPAPVGNRVPSVKPVTFGPLT
jgi:hypothetical protein